MYDALMLFSEHLLIYAWLRMTISGGNRTTRYNCRFSSMSLTLQVIFVQRKRPPICALCTTISGGRTEHVVIGFGELAAVD